MWSSLCNFLCNKLFQRQKIGFQHRCDSCEGLQGKRMKLVNCLYDANGEINQTTTSLFMQKENVEINDNEEECCIVAEIPRRKKAWGLIEPKEKSNLTAPIIGGIHGHVPQFTFKKSSIDKFKNEEGKFPGKNSGSDENSKGQTKKFFNSPRICLSHGKLAKSKSYFKNNLKRKMNFLQESYRLTEKFQYMQLLQSHTTYNLLEVRPPPRSVKCLPAAVEVIDLTDENSSDNNEIFVETLKSKSEDQDIQILKDISGVKSFQDLLKIRPVSTEVAVNKNVSKYSKDCSDIVKLNKIPENTNNSLNEDYSCQKTEELEEKLHNFMVITTPTIPEVEIIGESSLPVFSLEQQRRIKNALIPEPSEEILSQGFGLKITRRDMQSLLGLNWLNDEVINFYCNLIMARSERNKKLPKVYAFNTFFYPNLVSSGYSKLKRWTKQVDIFTFDLILVPIHLKMHWCMCIIDFRKKSVRYYDSIGSPNNSCLERLLFYLKAESLDKTKKVFSTIDWEKKNVENIPQQMNGADCGVFSCMFAEYLTRDCCVSFTQDDMPYFRKKMIIEILEKNLLT